MCMIHTLGPQDSSPHADRKTVCVCCAARGLAIFLGMSHRRIAVSPDAYTRVSSFVNFSRSR